MWDDSEIFDASVNEGAFSGKQTEKVSDQKIV